MGKNTPASSIASITDLKTLQAEIERLKKENEALAAAKKAGAHTLSVKASAKGAVSVYGLGRFPVTLYAEQWDRLLANAEKVKGFIEENRETLATKDRRGLTVCME